MSRNFARRPVRAASWMLATAIVAGCGAPLTREAPGLAAALEVPGRWSAAAAAGPVRQAWLDRFGDDSLERLVEEAVTANFDLRAVAARLAQARARARIAGAAERPRLDSRAGGARRGAPAGGGRRTTASTFDGSLDASWEVDLWDRLADATRAAALDAGAAAADHRAARLSLAANVARSWFGAVETSLQLDLAEETAHNFRDNLDIVEEGFRAGLNSALDVRLERANLAQAESRVHARRRDRDVAIRELEVLLGRYPSAELAVATELATLEAAVPAGLPAALLERRPDLRAAAIRLDASDERLAAARKNRLPRMVLTAQGGVTSTELRDLLDPKSLLWRLATELTAPLLRGGELAAERDLARAERAEALADYAQAVLVAFREVETALTAERLLADEEAARREAARESREAEALALERYQRGLVDIVTWLEARRRAFDARSTLLAVSNQRLQNRIALHLALGGDFGEAGDAPGAQTAGVPGRAGPRRVAAETR